MEFCDRSLQFFSFLAKIFFGDPPEIREFVFGFRATIRGFIVCIRRKTFICSKGRKFDVKNWAKTPIFQRLNRIFYEFNLKNFCEKFPYFEVTLCHCLEF